MNYEEFLISKGLDINMNFGRGYYLDYLSEQFSLTSDFLLHKKHIISQPNNPNFEEIRIFENDINVLVELIKNDLDKLISLIEMLPD